LHEVERTARDVASAMRLLEVMYPNFDVVFVREMPRGMRWCIHGSRIFIRMHNPPGSGAPLHEALAALRAGARPTRPILTPIPGGRTGPRRYDGPPVRATGSR
jgi:hypothetical protein